ncbi:MAG: nucleotidyltransferase domain-containing protein [Candidatus Aenigmarchaeota archaeon]|nr:nucleotidyltransferase domain-containing protein [Candidatus Aenigmarchaeota archaeon]
MYDKLNITENHLRVLSLFTDGYDREYYIREVEKLLKISPRTAQLILEGLEYKGIITSKIKGKIKAYTLKRSTSCQRYLAFTEQYKAITFFEKNLMIKEIIEKISPLISGIGVIFGSYAKGTENKHSDLDVFVAGKYDMQGIRKVSELYGVDVSVKSYPLRTFEKNVENDVLLKEILKNHVVFLGLEQFVKAVLMDG